MRVDSQARVYLQKKTYLTNLDHYLVAVAQRQHLGLELSSLKHTRASSNPPRNQARIYRNSTLQSAPTASLTVAADASDSDAGHAKHGVSEMLLNGGMARKGTKKVQTKQEIKYRVSFVTMAWRHKPRSAFDTIRYAQECYIIS